MNGILKPDDIAIKKSEIQMIDGYLKPQSFSELYRFCEWLAKSSFLPKSYQGKTIEQRACDAMVAIQLGSEIGLSPMIAIQNIAVINGQPSIWGDAQLALVRSSGELEYIKESFEGAFPNKDFKAVCIVKRRGGDEVKEEFSINDAITAQLWNKSGTWTTYPKRMLKYRARSFALRDCFQDVLKGIHSVEEMDGSSEMINVTPSLSPQKEEKEKSNEQLVRELISQINLIFQEEFKEKTELILERARAELNQEENIRIKECILKRKNELIAKGLKNAVAI